MDFNILKEHWRLRKALIETKLPKFKRYEKKNFLKILHPMVKIPWDSIFNLS